MNIEEYRALKAQEAEQKNSTEKEQTNVQANESTVISHEPTDTKTEQTNPVSVEEGDKGATSTESKEPTQAQVDKITIDGKELSLEEIREFQKGYMLHSDYTQKTQALAEQRKQLAPLLQLQEQLQKNPELAKQIATEHGLTALDPDVQRTAQMEAELWELKLERELNTLESKYEDFNRQEVLQLAYDRRLDNLEDAYLLNKSLKPPVVNTEQEPKTTGVDLEAIKREIREELKREFASQVDTTTLISTKSGNAPVQDNTPKLSEDEAKIAKIYGMTPEEYLKWR